MRRRVRRARTRRSARLSQARPCPPSPPPGPVSLRRRRSAGSAARTAGRCGPKRKRRAGRRRDIHVGQVAEGVTRRDRQRTAERDGQVGEVAADAEARGVRLPCRGGRAAAAVAETARPMSPGTRPGRPHAAHRQDNSSSSYILSSRHQRRTMTIYRDRIARCLKGSAGCREQVAGLGTSILASSMSSIV